MRLVHAESLDRKVSAIGFGCASLGSRISVTDGRRAFDQAFDLGVRWYDVAPPYGDGQAEELLGRFLAGRRDKVVICTKFGIASPRISLPKRVSRPVVRSIVAAFPQLRGMMSRGRPTGVRAPIDPCRIEESVVASLRRLRTDYIDVLAFHEPTEGEAADGRIFEELEGLVRRGLVCALSVGGSPASIAASIEAHQPLAFAQFRDGPALHAARDLRNRLRSTTEPVFVTHGVFSPNAVDLLMKAMQKKQSELQNLASKYGLGPQPSLSDFLMNFAFANNPCGVVLVSMFSAAHVDLNCRLARVEPSPSFASDLETILEGSTLGHAL